MDLNKWVAVGKVNGVPQISEKAGKKQSFFHFTVNRRAQDNNEQWVDVPMSVPVFASDKKAELIENYVVDGQELMIEGYYMSWDAGNGQLGHGMAIQNVSFGFKPKKDVQAPSAGPSSGPPI